LATAPGDSKPNDRQWALQSVTDCASSDPRWAWNHRISQLHFSRSPLLTAPLGLIRAAPPGVVRRPPRHRAIPW